MCRTAASPPSSVSLRLAPSSRGAMAAVRALPLGPVTVVNLMPEPPAPLHAGHGDGGTSSMVLVYQARGAGKAASRSQPPEPSGARHGNNASPGGKCYHSGCMATGRSRRLRVFGVRPLPAGARSSTDRAPDFESGGCTFEPCRAHHTHQRF